MNRGNPKRRLVSALLYTMGERDAALGVSPKRTSKSYIRGYAVQYAREAVMSAMQVQDVVF